MSTTPLFIIASEALPDADVVALRGDEALSEPYRFAVGLLTADRIDHDSTIGARVTLNGVAVSAPWVVHGIIASIEHLHQLDGQLLYQLVIVPRLWRLSQSQHSQIYVDKTDVEIVEQVLRAGGLDDDDLRFDLTSAYPREAHVCQYHEDDLSFVSRLLERQGIHYFFEQLDDRERMVLCDHASGHRPLVDEALRFVPGAADDATRSEALRAFRCRTSVVPGSVCLRDYDYAHPAVDVSGRAVVSAGAGEINVHGENFTTPDEGRRLAAVRAEEISCRRRLFVGNGRVPLRTGFTFALAEHPHETFNDEYLIVRLEHRGHSAAASAEIRALLGSDGDDEYRIDLVAIGAREPFRPERKTPKPRIYGVENGIVDGAADSPYAQLDAHGRYKVKIDFDEADEAGGRASTWVRMLQPHGGTGEGFHFPLRKGTEVLLTFLGGDPDRPVISGVLPNAHTPSPVTADNHTQNVIQSGGLNRLEMDDLAGQERTTLSTPTEASYLSIGARRDDSHYNVDLSTHGDSRLYSGREMDVVVDSHASEKVAGNVLHAHQKNQEVTVGANKAMVVGGDDTRDVKGAQITDVEGEVAKTYQRDYQKRVHGSYNKHIGTSSYVEDIDTGGSVEIKTDGSFKVFTNGEEIRLENADDAYIKLTADGDIDLSCNTLNVEQTSTTDISSEFRMGATTSTFLGAVNENFVGIKNENTLAGSVEINVGGSLTVDVGLRLEYAHFPTIALAPLEEDTVAISSRNNTVSQKKAATSLGIFGVLLLKGPIISK